MGGTPPDEDKGRELIGRLALPALLATWPGMHAEPPLTLDQVRCLVGGLVSLRSVCAGERQPPRLTRGVEAPGFLVVGVVLARDVEGRAQRI